PVCRDHDAGGIGAGGAAAVDGAAAVGVHRDDAAVEVGGAAAVGGDDEDAFVAVSGQVAVLIHAGDAGIAKQGAVRIARGRPHGNAVDRIDEALHGCLQRPLRGGNPDDVGDDDLRQGREIQFA